MPAPSRADKDFNTTFRALLVHGTNLGMPPGFGKDGDAQLSVIQGPTSLSSRGQSIKTRSLPRRFNSNRAMGQ